MPTFSILLSLLAVPIVAQPSQNGTTAGQDIVEHSTVKAIYEMPRCTARDSEGRKICDDIGEQRDKDDRVLKLPLSRVLMDTTEDPLKRVELLRTAIIEVAERPNDPYSEHTRKALLEFVEDVSDRVILHDTVRASVPKLRVRVGNTSYESVPRTMKLTNPPDINVEVTFAYIDKPRPDLALVIAAESDSEVQIVMERHPRHREILKRLAGAWKNKKRSFYATSATPTTVLNAFAVQGYNVVCHRATHDGEKMFWTLQLAV